MEATAIAKRHDDWIEVPAVFPDTGVEYPIELRPGTDAGRISLKVLGAQPVDVSRLDLVAAMRMLEEDQ
jgi:hypothetical protein